MYKGVCKPSLLYTECFQQQIISQLKNIYDPFLQIPVVFVFEVLQALTSTCNWMASCLTNYFKMP